MEDWLTASSSDEIRILHLDDDEELAELTKLYLEDEVEEFEVIKEHRPQAALERLAAESFDIVVSDYDMPEMDGLEFLDAVRENHPDLPFILFTGKGSEEIASEAISRGVTDYLEKYGGGEQYEVLANRIENAVGQYRAEQLVERRSEWYSRILEYMSDYVMIVDEMGDVRYVSPGIKRVMGYTQEEIIGTDSLRTIHPDDLANAAKSLEKVVTNPDREVTVEFRSQAADGSYKWLEVRGRNYSEDELIQGVMVNVREITQRKEREQEIRRHNERLDEFVSVASHDLRNPLNVAMGRLDMVMDEIDNQHLEVVDSSLERMNELIDNLLTLAQSGQTPTDEETVTVADVMQDAWSNVKTYDASLNVDTDLTIQASRSRLQQIGENLIRNSIEYGGHDVTVEVGDLDNDAGFYIADDGPGISGDIQDKIFESGFSTVEGGTGFGLSIVREVANAHGWDLEHVSEESDGARFEFRDVEAVKQQPA